MNSIERVGILLMNTGTTAAPRAAETRTYLREFLSDPRVLDINPISRWLILNLFILPFRPAKSAEAYEAVWTETGSPLLALSEKLLERLRQRMPEAAIEIGMRYGKPSITEAFDKLIAQDVDRILAVPLFPQYASAANGSVLEMVHRLAAEKWNVPPISTLPAFYLDEGFIDSWVAVSKPILDDFEADLVLMSYHGLPERQVKKSDPGGRHCLVKSGCCDRAVPENAYCYRHHCMETSRALAAKLGLANEQWQVSFQSRLGRDPWLKPPTDEVVPALPKQGVKRLAVLCPAFTVDCLETLEEIGIRAKEDFLGAGGEAFQLVPCLNDHPKWVNALANMLQQI
ncbi:MAG: ferrochelatase [Candidatus Hydrogenedentota bacterium]